MKQGRVIDTSKWEEFKKGLVDLLNKHRIPIDALCVLEEMKEHICKIKGLSNVKIESMEIEDGKVPFFPPNETIN